MLEYLLTLLQNLNNIVDEHIFKVLLLLFLGIYILWQLYKKPNSKNKYIYGGIFIFIIPITMISFLKNIIFYLPGTMIGSIDGWLGFLGGYIGALLALGGIWWQLREEKIKEELDKKNDLEFQIKNILTIIDFLLHENFEKKTDFLSSFKFLEFPNNFINENFYTISLLKIEKNLFKLDIEFKEFNKLFFDFENKSKNNEIFIREVIETLKLNHLKINQKEAKLELINIFRDFESNFKLMLENLENTPLEDYWHLEQDMFYEKNNLRRINSIIQNNYYYKNKEKFGDISKYLTYLLMLNLDFLPSIQNFSEPEKYKEKLLKNYFELKNCYYTVFKFLNFASITNKTLSYEYSEFKLLLNKEKHIKFLISSLNKDIVEIKKAY